jgi:hypothetical protein
MNRHEKEGIAPPYWRGALWTTRLVNRSHRSRQKKVTGKADSLIINLMLRFTNLLYALLPVRWR